MNYNLDASARSYRNLTLSYRGSERQSPNCLQLALRFSRIMEAKKSEHPPGTSTWDRLQSVIMGFHNDHGLQAKHRLDEDKQKTVFNMISGTCAVPLACFIQRFFVLKKPCFSRSVFLFFLTLRGDCPMLPTQGRSAHHATSHRPCEVGPFGFFD